MKKIVSIILLCMIISTIYVGCGKQMKENEQISQTATIGNPWSDWDSIEEAESVIGFSFGLPEVIADSYNAVSVRTMNDKLIEVVYRDKDFEVCVRKQKGEGQDISGDYNKYETCTETNYNGGLYVNKYCYYFTVRATGGMDIFKSEITKPVRNDYCGNGIKSTVSEFSR